MGMLDHYLEQVYLEKYDEKLISNLKDIIKNHRGDKKSGKLAKLLAEEIIKSKRKALEDTTSQMTDLILDVISSIDDADDFEVANRIISKLQRRMIFKRVEKPGDL